MRKDLRKVWDREYRSNTTTYFFREFDAIEVARDFALSRGAGGGTVNIWCAGCSTGEEAYTLAIVARELGLSVHVLATDVNPDALAHAQAGIYAAHSLRHATDERRTRWFAPHEGLFRVSKEIRRMLTFREHDLVLDTVPKISERYKGPSRGWDVIFCRNVFLYFDRESTVRAATTLASAVHPEGVIVLGAAERFSEATQLALPLAVALEPVQLKRVVVYRRAVSEERSTTLRSMVGYDDPDELEKLPECAPGSVGAHAYSPHSGAENDDTTPRDQSRVVVASAKKLGLVDAGRIDDAFVREAASTGPTSMVGALRTEGDRLLDEGYAEKALAKYREAIVDDSLLADLHLRAGFCYLQLDRGIDARAALRRSLFLDADLWPASFLLGELVFADDKPGARRYFMQARRAILDMPGRTGPVVPFACGSNAALETIEVRLRMLEGQ